jgi:hypothetical protein
MAKGRSTIIVAVLIFWTVMPAVRCLVLTELLSTAERACCTRMAGECGPMPSNHECCKKITATPQNAMVTAKTAVAKADVAVGAMVTSALAVNAVPVVFLERVLLDPSPPPLSSTTVLRI